MADNVIESPAWPVNENGCIVFGSGSGSTNITGYLPNDFIPTNIDGTIAAVGLGSTNAGTFVIRPSGDTTGVTDSAAFIGAAAAITTLGAGKILFSAGTFYFNNQQRRIPNNCDVVGNGRNNTYIKYVWDGVTTNIQANIFEAISVNNWSLSDMTLDWQYWYDPQDTPGFDSFDSTFNCLRLANTQHWRIENCVLANAGFHGLIGVDRVSHGIITKCEVYGNGARAIHLHSEGTGFTRTIQIFDNDIHNNGRSYIRVFSCRVSTTSGSGNVVLSSADYLTLKKILSVSSTQDPIFIIKGVGAGNGDWYDRATSFVDGTNTAVSPRLAQVTSSDAIATFYFSPNSGIFASFGSDEILLTNNRIFNEGGSGIEIQNYNNTARNLLATGYGAAFTNSTTQIQLGNILAFNTTDYNNIKSATTTAGANASVQIYHSTLTDDETYYFGSANIIFNDSAKTITFSGAKPPKFYNGPGYKVEVLQIVASGGTQVVQSVQQYIYGNFIKNCVYGITCSGNNIVLDNFIEGSQIAAIRLTSGSSNIVINGRITNSGMSHIYAPLVSNGTLDQIIINATMDNCGGSAVLTNTSGASGKISNITFSNNCVITNSGQNPAFANSNNLQGGPTGYAVHMMGDGNNQHHSINFFNTFRYNNYGSVRISRGNRINAIGAIFEDNCLSGAANGQSEFVILNSNSNYVTVDSCRFMNILRTNSGLTLDSNAIANSLFRNNVTNFNRGGAGGNIVTFGSNANDSTNYYYGNTYPSNSTIQFGQNTMPNSSGEVVGYRSNTTSYTVTLNDNTLAGDATTATFAYTLPLANTCKGQRFTFKKSDSSVNAVTISRSGSDTIDGGTSYSLSTQYATVTMVSDGVSAWRITAKF